MCLALIVLVGVLAVVLGTVKAAVVWKLESNRGDDTINTPTKLGASDFAANGVTQLNDFFYVVEDGGETTLLSCSNRMVRKASVEGTWFYLDCFSTLAEEVSPTAEAEAGSLSLDVVLIYQAPGQNEYVTISADTSDADYAFKKVSSTAWAVMNRKDQMGGGVTDRKIVVHDCSPFPTAGFADTLEASSVCRIRADVEDGGDGTRRKRSKKTIVDEPFGEATGFKQLALAKAALGAAARDDDEQPVVPQPSGASFLAPSIASLVVGLGIFLFV